MTLELARKNCPKGEHLSKAKPIVCVPNKDRADFVDPIVVDLGSAIVVLAAVIAVPATLISRWRTKRRHRNEAPRVTYALPLGTGVTSPTMGRGDLGWLSPKGDAILPADRLNLHVLVAGATGSGKSTTVERIERRAVEIYRPQVIHFDCKGRRDGAARFLSIMLGAGYEQDGIRIAPIEPYDGWRGDSRAHLNRLLAVQDFSENQPYYTAGTKDLLQQAIADGPILPRLSGELVERLQRDRDGIDPKVASGALARYRGFFSSLDGLLDGSWAFDDVDACYIELPGMARREDAIAFGRYLLEDFMHYIAERKDPDREVLLVLDDFSAISTGDEAVNLVERAREFGVGVVITSQSYAGLGRGAGRIVDACNGALIVHRMSDPEPFISRAGTVWRNVTSITQPAYQPGLISGILFGHKPETPRHTTRAEEFPRIDPNEARCLPPGEAFVIAEGRAQRIRVDHLDILEERRVIPYVGEVSLLDLARAELRRRRGAARDLQPPERSPVPGEDPDPDLDF